MTGPSTKLRQHMARMGAGIVILDGVLAGLLFGAAGRIDWPAAWWLLGGYTAFLTFIMAWGAVYAPELMAERARVAANVKAWDKLINVLSTLALIGLFVIAGLDERYGGSALPLAVQIAGGLAASGAGGVVWWVMKENAYLSRWARIQSDRGQTVISSGPYRFVRHPMYAALTVLIVGVALQLGSAWALIQASLVVAIYALRTWLEDQMLHEELPGYREYAQQVRYRLIPYLW